MNPFAAAAARAVAKALDMAPDDFTVSAPPCAELGDFAVSLFPAAKTPPVLEAGPLTPERPCPPAVLSPPQGMPAPAGNFPGQRPS